MGAPVRLSRATARAVDRLSRRAHAFHRFAHHPLCDRYASELVTLGRRQRLCRGCLAVALGAPLGAAVALLTSVSSMTLYGAIALGAALFAASLRVRVPKFLGRFVPAACLGAGVASALTCPHSLAWLLALACVGAGFALYRQRGPSRSACATCPERSRATPCSGFLPIVRRERAFRRVAERLIDRAAPSSLMRLPRA